MEARCPEHKKIGKGVLKDSRWIIAVRKNMKPAANIVISKGGFVEGYVFELSKKDEENLDRYEGKSYKKINLEIEMGLEYKTCMVYVDKKNVSQAGDIQKESVNTNQYKCTVGCLCTYGSRINKGIKDCQLSEKYVERDIRKFIDN
jgi:gamma-glutamylcyclotransferase (GGCT)/AIG2-like uncharacterized protein YtfP